MKAQPARISLADAHLSENQSFIIFRKYSLSKIDKFLVVTFFFLLFFFFFTCAWYLFIYCRRKMVSCFVFLGFTQCDWGGLCLVLAASIHCSRALGWTSCDGDALNDDINRVEEGDGGGWLTCKRALGSGCWVLAANEYHSKDAADTLRYCCYLLCAPFSAILSSVLAASVCAPSNNLRMMRERAIY